MKNLKILMVALALLALPAVALGQGVDCEVCTHQVSVYMGEGGLVAKATDADGEVTWVTECNGVSQWGKLTPNDDGMVAMLFNMDNGLDCASPGKDDKLEIGPVEDGGWYWITDDMNSAVGGLVNQKVYEALKDMTTDPTSAGSGVTMTKGTGAVYLKETASGRVGILPNILPVKPDDPDTKCGFAGKKRVKTDCMLGDGGTKISATGPVDTYTGKRTPIMNKGTVTRPGADGTMVTVQFKLLGNDTGHYTVGTGDVELGHNADHPLTASFTGKLGVTGPSGGSDLDSTANGLEMSSAGGVGTLTITPNAAYCPSTGTKHTASVTITAEVASTALATQIVPALPANHDPTDANADPNPTSDDTHRNTFTLNVSCPGGASSSSHRGVELVPDNPFPTDW